MNTVVSFKAPETIAKLETAQASRTIQFEKAVEIESAEYNRRSTIELLSLRRGEVGFEPTHSVPELEGSTFIATD